MSVRPSLLAALLCLGTSAGCLDGLTNQQRFELRQQKLQLEHERAVAARRETDTMIAQIMEAMLSARQNPYSVRVDEEGRPILVVSGATPREYVLDLERNMILPIPTTRPAK